VNNNCGIEAVTNNSNVTNQFELLRNKTQGFTQNFNDLSYSELIYTLFYIVLSYFFGEDNNNEDKTDSKKNS
jgi:hypothetical protein